jgi:hypothetical protein
MTETRRSTPQRISLQEAYQGVAVHIDHAYTGQHLNPHGYAGGEGTCVLFDDHDDANWLGESWILEPQDDGTVKIKNNQTSLYLAALSNPTYQLFRAEVRLPATNETPPPAGHTWEKKWVLNPAGFGEVFTIRPAGDHTLAISPHATAPVGNPGTQLQILNEGPYLNQLFTLVRAWPDKQGRAHGGGQKPGVEQDQV